MKTTFPQISDVLSKFKIELLTFEKVFPSMRRVRVGFDFDGGIHPTSDDIHTLIRDQSVSTEITDVIDVIKRHIQNNDDVFIVSSNTTVGVNGINTFLKYYNIYLPIERIIADPGAKSTHINQHKITQFYEDSQKHIDEISTHTNAENCKVIHWKAVERYSAALQERSDSDDSDDSEDSEDSDIYEEGKSRSDSDDDY